MENRNFKLIWILFISCLLHYIVIEGFQILSILFPQQPHQSALYNLTPKLPETAPTEISIIEHPESHFVRDTEVDPHLLEENTKKTNLVSAHQVRVKQQTQAQKTGLTANRQQAPEKTNYRTLKELTSLKASHQTDPLKSESKNDPEILTASDRKFFENDVKKELAKGISTSNQILNRDDIKFGNFTAMNTDRYLFYSFFSRIEDRIRSPWEDQVEQAMSQYRAKLISQIRSNWVTEIEINLKPNGEFHSAHVLKESGIKGFDEATIKPFVEAQIFPNPPKELIKPDGLIHLIYSFNVVYDPKGLVYR
jgi:hypothetical protein